MGCSTYLSNTLGRVHHGAVIHVGGQERAIGSIPQAQREQLLSLALVLVQSYEAVKREWSLGVDG